MSSLENGFGQQSAGAPDLEVPIEDRYQLFVDAVQDYAIFMLSPSGHIASWNKGAQRAKGYTREEIIGRHFSVFYTPEDIAAGKPERELVIATVQGRVEDEGWRVRCDGSRFWADVVITAVHDASGTLVGFSKVTRDITERRRLAELENASRVSAQMLAAREDEQKRIARELHDDLGQQITALKMSVALLEAKLGASGIAQQFLPDTGAFQSQIDSMALSVRRIASDLRPPVLDDLGLIAALEWLAEGFQQRCGVRVAVRVAVGDLSFSALAATAIFRMVQEALTNVARHAQASEVLIDMRHTGSACTVRIEDNGAGMVLGGPRKPKSFGLLGIEERVRQLNGSVSIESAPGQGFKIAIELPVSKIVTGATD